MEELRRFAETEGIDPEEVLRKFESSYIEEYYVGEGNGSGSKLNRAKSRSPNRDNF